VKRFALAVEIQEGIAPYKGELEKLVHEEPVHEVGCQNKLADFFVVGWLMRQKSIES
jgi:hypothetical protein